MTIIKRFIKEEPANGVPPNFNSTKKKSNATTSLQPYWLAKTIILSASAIIAIMVLSSCSRKAMFQISPIVPAARGYVKTKRDKNKNYTIQVYLENLAEPNRLTPPKQVYVVWIESANNVSMNVGQVKTGTSIFSSTLKGSFETVSAFKPLKVFITAEEDASVQYPGRMMVMTTNNF